MPFEPTSLSKETYDLAETKAPGGRILAPLALLLGLVAIIVGSAGYIFSNVLRPLALVVTTFRGGPVGWLAFSALVTAIVVAGVFVWFLIRRRINELEGHIRWVRAKSKLLDVQKASDEDFQKLKDRVLQLESHTDVSGLRQAMTEELLRRQLPRP